MACLSTETWALGLRAWTLDQEPRDLAGIRGQAELRRGLWRVQGRLDGTASAGEYQPGQLNTVQDVEAHLAVAHDSLHLPQGVTIGPLAAVGAAVSLDHAKGMRVDIPNAVTAVLGLRIAWPGGWVEGGVGTIQEWERGVGAKATWQLRTSDRTAAVGTISWGRRWIDQTLSADGSVVVTQGYSASGFFAWVGVAIRVSGGGK